MKDEIYPGMLIDSVEYNDILHVLNALRDQVSIVDPQACSFAVANDGSNDLIKPKVFVDDGEMHGTMPPYIPVGYTGFMLFTRSLGKFMFMAMLISD